MKKIAMSSMSMTRSLTSPAFVSAIAAAFASAFIMTSAVAGDVCPLTAAHESVTLVKTWCDSAGNELPAIPTLSQTVTINFTSAKAWLRVIYPANDTAHPIITSAVQKPDDAGSSWPEEVGATFNSATSVTANSTKELSNVVLQFEDCAEQKFDSLKGYSRTFSGTGPNAGKTVIGVWIKSGSNKSNDGSGYGEYISRALMIASGVTYTVTETALPSGWACVSGLGTFTSNGGLDTHAVRNQQAISQTASVTIVKTAGTALDGETYTLNGTHIVTYHFAVSNTGTTWLKNLAVSDDVLGTIGTIAGPIAPGASQLLSLDATVSEDVTNTGTVVATPCTQNGGAVSGVPQQVSDSDQADVVVLPPLDREFVTLVKEWYDANTNLLASPPALSPPVVVSASNTYAWLTLSFPAGTTNAPIITSALLRPAGEGEEWPEQVSASFSSDFLSVTANSTKNLSNVVLEFADSSEQKFDGLSGLSQTFSGTGANASKQIVGVWIKSGSNASGDGPGFGSYLAPALMISEGASYTVAESALPEGWTCISGLGVFTSAGGTSTHIVENIMPPDPEPSVRLVKTASTAPDGDTLTLDAAGSATYSYFVQNTGNTYLKGFVVTDDKIGYVGTVAGPLAPSGFAVLTKDAAITATVTNLGTVVATPCHPSGTSLGLPNVTANDDAIVRLLPLSSIGDFVWLDLDADGIQDAGEPGLSGVTTALCDDAGNTLASMTTDANGHYLFTDLLPGTYKIRFEPIGDYVISASHEGEDDGADSDAEPSTGLSHSVTLPEGTVNLSVDAGMWHPEASIRLIKTAGNAPDGEGFSIVGPGSVTYTYAVENTGNTWLRNVTVTDDKLGFVGTFAGLLAPGAVTNITASTTVSAGVTNIGTVTGTPSTPQGDDISNLDDVADGDDAVVVVLPAGLASLGDRVWIDANKNGVQDAGELGLIGVTVSLLDANTNAVSSTVTANDGSYRFDNLPAGSYRLRFTPPSTVWRFTDQDQGANNAADSDADLESGLTALITLASGQQDLTWDAGVYGDLPPGFCHQMTVGENFNALILGNFSASGGDTEGRLAVGGNAVFNTGIGYSVGISVYGEALPGNLTGVQDMLIARGDLNDGTFEVNGNVVYGGTRTGAERYDNPAQHVDPVSLGDDGNVPRDGSGTSFETRFEQLRLASAMISTMADRGVVTNDVVSSSPNIILTGDHPILNVFNVAASDWNGPGRGILISAPEYSTVVVNIHGSPVQLSGGDIILTGVTNDRILFNYADATEISTTRFRHHGAVMAPYANAFFSGGYFSGFGVFGGNVVTTNGFEFHHFPFRGTVCTEAEINPSIKLMTTAGNAADGAVLTVLGGSAVNVSYRITNAGNTPLDQITVTDSVLGQVGSMSQGLGAGESITLSAVLPNVMSDTLLNATVSGRPVRADGTILNGYATVSDADSASVVIGSPSSGGDVDPSASWQRADFAVTGIAFVTKPTLTGEVFSVQVTVDNHGELAADAGRLTLYLDKPGFATVGEAGAAYKNAGVIMPGASKTLVFQLTSGSEPGTRHLRAYADSLGQVDEWSDGDNQRSAVYELNPISLYINSVDEGMELSWPSFWGQRYTIYRCTDLSKGFLLYKSNLEATPPENTYIDAEEHAVRFYRLVVEQE